MAPKQRPPTSDPKQRRRTRNPKQRGPECPCGEPVGDKAYLCRKCTDELRSLLQGIPTLAEAVAITYTKRSQMFDRSSGSRSADQAVLFSDAARDEADHLAQVLARWVVSILSVRETTTAGPACIGCHHDTCKTYRATRQPNADAVTMSRWLLWNVVWIRRRENAAAFLSEIRGTISRVQRTVDRPPDGWYAGPCREEYLIYYDLDGKAHHGQIRADIPVEYTAAASCLTDLYAKPDAHKLKCWRCKTEYDIPARRAWLLSYAEDMVAAPSLISAALTRVGEPITPERLRQWKHRSRIAPAACSWPDGQELYRIGEVIDLIHDHATEQQRRAEKKARCEEAEDEKKSRHAAAVA